MRVAPVVLVLLSSGGAFAEPLTHKGQFEASLRIPIGLRAVVPYEKGTYCGKLDPTADSGFSPACTGRSPFAFDLELGYGVHRRIDVFLELRIGLEQDFGATPTAVEGPRTF